MSSFDKAIEIIMAEPPEPHYPAYYADLLRKADVPDGNAGECSDSISRQAVLDYIDNMPSELTKDGRRMIRRIRLTEYIQDSMPPAHPQIIRCKDCDWWSPMLDSLQGRCALHGSHPTGAWFCGSARRKTDGEIK